MKRRIRMKRRTRFAAVIAAAALFLGACSGGGNGGSDESANASAEPVAGGDLTVGIQNEPTSLNPHFAQQAALFGIYRDIGDSYLYQDAAGEFHPWLASEYSVSDDGTQVTLTLREDVTFSDGSALNAGVVKANFDKLLDPDYGVTNAGLRNLESTEALDASTVQFTLSHPDNLFVAFLASVYAAPVSQQSLDGDADDLRSGTDISLTGPFTVESFQQNDQLVLAKRDDYAWAPEALTGRSGAAYLDTVTYRFLAEASTRTGALQSGQVDVIDSVPSQDVSLFNDSEDYSYTSLLNAGSPYTLYFNVSKEPLDDLRVRQAIQQGIDIDSILNATYFGTATRAWSVVSPTVPFYDESMDGGITFDVDAANALLDDAGWTERDDEGFRVKDGERLAIDNFTGAPMVRDSREILNESVGTQLRENLGIQYNYTLVDLGTEAVHEEENTYDVFDNSYISGDYAGTDVLWSSEPGRGIISRTKHGDDVVDELINTGRSTLDQGERSEIYTEFQNYVVHEKAYALPLYVNASTRASTSGVQGQLTDEALGIPWGSYNTWKAN